jgi:hypothetical protein
MKSQKTASTREREGTTKKEQGAVADDRKRHQERYHKEN